jgi:uncharacterized protein YndB with AHSA1/START domain
MALRSETRAQIDSSVEDVYRYLSDVSRWPEWATAIRACSVSGGGPLRTGCTLEQRVKGVFGSTRDRTLAVNAVDAPSRLEFAGDMGPSALRWGFELAATEAASTDIVLWVEVELHSLMRAIPAGLIREMIHRVNDRELAAIKAKVSSPRPRHAATSV